MKTNQQDTGMVNINFNPAQLVIKDNRMLGDLVSIIERNSASNSQVAAAIERVATISERTLSLEERRWESVMTRCTQQTGLSVEAVTKIIHKKRVYDITFYTLFTVYGIFLITAFLHNYSTLSLSDNLLKIIVGIGAGALFWVLYIAVGGIITGSNSQIIYNIINSPPG
jgi:hypothetical protein